jgi:hypothetical protein
MGGIPHPYLGPDPDDAAKRKCYNIYEVYLSTLETKFFQVFHHDVGVGWRLKPRLRLQSPPSGTYNSPTKVGFATVARDFSRWARA